MGNPMEDPQLPRSSFSKVFLQPKKIEKHKSGKINFPIAFWLCLIFEISTPAFLYVKAIVCCAFIVNKRICLLFRSHIHSRYFFSVLYIFLRQFTEF